jgi:hypothetical protein
MRLKNRDNFAESDDFLDELPVNRNCLIFLRKILPGTANYTTTAIGGGFRIQ